MRTAYRVVYGLCAASYTAPQYARTLNELRVLGDVLHREYVLRVQLFQGCQSLMAWQYSFSQDTSYEDGELPLAEQSARRYWRGVEGGTVLNLSLTVSQENIGHYLAKAKLIVFIDDSKNSNA
jgi:hypothetical protein